MKKYLLAAVAALALGSAAQAQTYIPSFGYPLLGGVSVNPHSPAYLEGQMLALRVQRMKMENQILALKLKQLQAIQNGRGQQ